MPDQILCAATPAITRRQVFLMAVSCALAVSAVYYNQPLLPIMGSTFGVTPALASLIATLTQLGYAMGLLVFVPLADGVQPRKLATRLIVANAVALLSCSVAPTFLALSVCSFLVGMSAVTAQVIIPSFAGRATHETRGRIVGSLLGGVASGVLLARTLSGFVGAHTGWRAVFVFASAVDFALLVVVIRELPVSTNLSVIRYGELMRSLIALVREERLLRISAATGFMTFAAFSALWGTLAALLARPPYGLGPASVGAFALVGLLGPFTSPLIGSAVDRMGARSVACVGAITLGVGFAFVAASGSSLAWLVAGIVCIDMGNRAGFVANQARIYTLRANARSRLNTVFMVSYFSGGATGAALGGYGAQHNGWIGLAVVGAGLALGAAAFNALSYKASGVMLAEERA